MNKMKQQVTEIDCTIQKSYEEMAGLVFQETDKKDSVAGTTLSE